MILILLYIALIIYLLFLFSLSKGHYYSLSGVFNKSIPKVSIIVAVRNQGRDILSCLNALVNQKYPAGNLQILIIDDQSTDETPAIINQFTEKHKNIVTFKSTNPLDWKSSKKAALQLGFEHAEGEIVLFSDGDCQPPTTWVKSMAAQFTPKTGLVAGFSPQTGSSKSLWNGFLLIDSLSAAIVAAFGVNRQKGITCAGRNLALRKQTLQDIGGFHALPDTLSGDDDFLLQEVCQNSNWQTKYAFSNESHVPASGPVNFIHFLKQKNRHLSSGKTYSFLQQAGYSLYHLLNYFFWIFAIAGIFTLRIEWITVLFIKLYIDFLTLYVFSKNLNCGFHAKAFFIWQVLFPLYHLLSAPVSLFKNKSWN